jgi:predicted LPLAT superfamily acyltransferase
MSFLRRFSVYGDFWLRYLEWGARVCPWFMEPVFMLVFTGMFWLCCGKARHAVATNLLTLIPGSWRWVNQFRAYRVFWNFAWTMTDLSHVRRGEKVITWEIVGKPQLRLLEEKTGGAVLLTAHMGNYDVAAPVFAHHFRRAVHMVRAPERDAESQKFQVENRLKDKNGQFVVHYNEPGNMLGIELAAAIGEGGVVAIQGDRILFDVSPMKVPFKDGVEWQVPEGPFLLALISKVEIHPVFILRLGYRRYRVLAKDAIGLKVVGRDKKGAMRVAAEAWNEAIRPVMEKHWMQWFVFEPVFTQAAKSREEARG